MTEYQLNSLLEMKERIIEKVERKRLKVQDGADLLGITRQGFLKLRKQYRTHGTKALAGLKHGPKSWHRPWNRTDEKLEEFVINFRRKNPLDGPITISWQLEDDYKISLPHQTIYRILQRAGLIEKQNHSRRDWKEVIASFPGERIQIDTCFPWGRYGPCVMEAVDVYSRWAYGQLFDHMVYFIPKVDGQNEAEIKENQKRFFSNIYLLLFNSKRGPRLSTFLWAVDKSECLRLLDIK